MTPRLLANVAGCLAARAAHQLQPELFEGAAAFERRQRYLATAVTLGRRRSVYV